jgi:minor extracellular serine protease Vpr
MRLTHLTIFVSIFVAGFALAPVTRAANPGTTRWIVLLNEKSVVERYPGRIEKTRAAAAPYRQHLQQVQAGMRSQIEATNARVTGSLQHLLNGVLVTATPAQAAALRKLPGVKAVMHVRTYHKSDQLSISNVQQAWTELGSSTGATAGAGIKIGIIDTGIDSNQPALQDPSLPPASGPVTYPVCDVPPPDCTGTLPSNCSLTNNKIIVARSYVCEIVYADDASSTNLPAQSRPDDLTARDLDGHGTGVASVAAGMPVTAGFNSTTGAPVNISGVAPKAYLGNYKIFGSDDTNPNGSGNILQALEDAVTDGMDIVNLSLGSPAYGGPLDTGCENGALPSGPISIDPEACDPFAYEVESAMENAQVTVVVAAGNAGANGFQFNYGCGTAPCDNFSAPTFSTVGSPAYAPSAIAVGGVQNDVTYVQRVEISGQTYDAYESYDGPPPLAPLTAPLVDTTQSGSLCAAAATSLSGDIALVQQGTCGDVTMVTNAQSAGAVGVIEIADAQAFYYPFGLSGTYIPTFIVTQSDGATLKTYIDANPGTKATMDPTPYQVSAESQGLLPLSIAYFSSRGPVNETGALKPDLVAAATDFLIPTETYDPYGELFNFSGYGTTQGTSFATPMVTGSAALVLQHNPNLTPLQIRSALVNTASLTNVSTSDGSAQASVSEGGAGLLQTQNAVISTVQAEPATVSFGNLTGPSSYITSQTVYFCNSGASAVTLALNVVPSLNFSSSSSSVAVSPTTVAVPVGTTSNPCTASVTVTLNGSVTVAGRFEGTITATGGPTPLTIPYMYLAGDGVPYDIIPMNDTEPGQGFIAFDGGVGAQIPWYQPCTNTNNNCINDYGPIAVQVIDQFGAPVAGYPITWAVTQGGGSIVENSSYTDTVTDANGIAGATVNVGSAGAQEFTVNVNGMVLPFDGYARVPPAVSSIQDAASYQSGKPIAPGSWIAVYGTNLTDTTQGNNGTDFPFAQCYLCNVLSQPLPMGIDGAAFSFNALNLPYGAPGRFSYVSPTQLNVQIPWELTGQTSAIVKSIVNYTYGQFQTLQLTQYSPGFYQVPIGSGNAAAETLPSYGIVTESNPVARGSYVQLFMNGLGPVNCTAGPPSCTTDNQPADGFGAPSGAPGDPLAMTAATPTVTIGGQPATVSFSGLAPGFASLYQVDVLVPANSGTGRQPITFSIGGVSAPAAYLYVQ